MNIRVKSSILYTPNRKPDINTSSSTLYSSSQKSSIQENADIYESSIKVWLDYEVKLADLRDEVKFLTQQNGNLCNDNLELIKKGYHLSAENQWLKIRLHHLEQKQKDKRVYTLQCESFNKNVAIHVEELNNHLKSLFYSKDREVQKRGKTILHLEKEIQQLKTAIENIKSQKKIIVEQRVRLQDQHRKEKACFQVRRLQFLNYIKMLSLSLYVLPLSHILDDTSQRQWLKSQFQRQIHKSELIYRASERNFENFNKICVNKAPLMFVIKSQNGNIFGAFISKPLKIVGLSEIDTQQESFLYSLNHQKKIPIKPNKSPIYYDPAFGPVIGESQIRIDNKTQKGFSNYGFIGSVFEKIQGIVNYKEFLGGSQDFKVEEYEVYIMEFKQ